MVAPLIILRYELVAELSLPPTARVGDAVPIEGRLLFRGQVFQDDAFFTADGFTAALRVDGASIPLTHVGGGRFQGTWTPPSPGPRQATLAFTTSWLETTARQPIAVEGFLDLTLRPDPNPLDLGTWRGERRPTTSAIKTRTQHSATFSSWSSASSRSKAGSTN